MLYMLDATRASQGLVPYGIDTLYTFKASHLKIPIRREHAAQHLATPTTTNVLLRDDERCCTNLLYIHQG